MLWAIENYQEFYNLAERIAEKEVIRIVDTEHDTEHETVEHDTVCFY